jgi:acylphosphatase
LTDSAATPGCEARPATRRFVVLGKVQGVYFRHSTRLEAERLGVRGVARNLPDGSVEVIAQGAAEAVENLHRWLQRGPKNARVATVRELDAPVAGVPVAGLPVAAAPASDPNAEWPGFSIE